MTAGLIRGHPLGVFFIVCLLLVIVETGLLLTALIVNIIVKYCQIERLPAVQLEDPRFFQLPFSRLLVDVLSRTEKSLAFIGSPRRVMWSQSRNVDRRGTFDNANDFVGLYPVRRKSRINSQLLVSR